MTVWSRLTFSVTMMAALKDQLCRAPEGRFSESYSLATCVFKTKTVPRSCAAFDQFGPILADLARFGLIWA